MFGRWSNKRSTSTAVSAEVEIELDNKQDEQVVPKIVAGNRPNIELVIIPRLAVDCPFVASGIIDAVTKLKERIVTGSSWSVCPVTDLINLLDIDMTVERKKALEKLRLIHCVDWRKIHPLAVEQIPDLINLIINPRVSNVETLLKTGYINLKDI